MRGIHLFLIGALSTMTAVGLSAEETPEAPRAARIVRFELEIVDPMDPTDLETAAVILGPQAVRLDSLVDESGSPSSSLIYRRKEKGYLLLIHDSGEALTYDLEEFRRYTERNEALQEKLWERLTTGRTPEEVEALKQMRESKREAARLGQQAALAGLSLERTSETGELDGHPWVRFQEFRSGTLSRDFLVTPWEHLGIPTETSQIFEEIAAFDEKRQEMLSGVGPAPDPFLHYREFGGFPLVSRQFDGEGNVVFESRVTAIETIEDSDALFGNPGYPEQGLSERVRVIE